jgi:hypothetical protein
MGTSYTPPLPPSSSMAYSGTALLFKESSGERRIILDIKCSTRATNEAYKLCLETL